MAEGSFPFVRGALSLGRFEARNRICLPAHTYGFPPTPLGVGAMSAYVQRRLRASVAMVVVGEAEVALDEGADRSSSPSRVAGAPSRKLYRALSTVARREGGIVVEQLYNAGGQVWFEEKRPAFGPSSVPQPISYVHPRGLTDVEVRRLIANFAACAKVVVENGLHGVEIKADQGKLHHQFLARRFNRRSDIWGGSKENRSRFLIETLSAVRRAIGPRPLIGVRLGGPVTAPTGPLDDADWGWDLSEEEVLYFVDQIVKSNTADYLSISGETNSTSWGYARNHGDESVPDMTFRSVARIIKERTSLPVILTGRVMSVAQAEELLANEECDMVGMTRALIADGELIEKALSDSPTQPIRPCVGCNISCVGRTWYGESVRCALDPVSGREVEFPAQIPSGRKRVAVLGGGPAGLEFARARSEADGGSIVLFELSDRVGGQVLDWARLPHRSSLLAAVSFWESALRSKGVTIRTAVPVVSVEDLLAEFDVVAVATGAPINVAATVGEVRQWNATGAINAPGNWGGKLVLVVETSRYADARGLAVYLSQLGAEVRVVSPFEYAGIGTDPVTFSNRTAEIRRAGIVEYSMCDVRVDRGGIRLLDQTRHEVQLLPGVTDVVWCGGPAPTATIEADEGKVVRIGECAGIAGLEAVVRHAYECARALSV